MRYRRVVVSGATYFFTLITHDRQTLFSTDANIALWRSAVAKVQRARPFIVEAEVVMPDHLHMIWHLPEDDGDYATRIRLIKTAFTKEFPKSNHGATTNDSRLSKGERAVWQRRYWEHMIRDEHDFHAHLDYIHLNPVKHGLVTQPGDWPHSTFLAWVARGTYEASWGSSELPPLPHRNGRE